MRFDPRDSNDRGLRGWKFTDTYQQSVSLHESSAAEFDAVWLGIGNDLMHITQDMAMELVAHLIFFSETGRLAPPESYEDEDDGEA